MTMTVMHNNSAMMTLGELKKNDTTLSKQLKKVASGMRVNSAGDDASGFAISERMRVRLRALEQNNTNVQNGASLLHVAEGGIQRQIDIMRTIKQKVIDAANDTNTDSDRATIQKEINQGYDQIEDIAYSTTYNGKLVLAGDTIRDRIYAWDKRSAAETVEGCAEMNVIADKYTMTGDPNLVDAPAKYDKLSGYELTDASVLGITDRRLSGGVNYQRVVEDVTFTATSTSDLIGKGLTVAVTDDAGNTATYAYVFADSADSKTYTDISGAAKTTTVNVSTSGSTLSAYASLLNAIRNDTGLAGSYSSTGVKLQGTHTSTGTTTKIDVAAAKSNEVSHTGTLSTGMATLSFSTGVTNSYDNWIAYSMNDVRPLKGTGLFVQLQDSMGNITKYGYVFDDITDSKTYTPYDDVVKMTTISIDSSSMDMATVYSLLAKAFAVDTGLSASSTANEVRLQDTTKTLRISFNDKTTGYVTGKVVDKYGIQGVSMTANESSSYQKPVRASTTVDLSGYTDVEAFIDDLTSDEQDHTDKGWWIFNRPYEFYDSKNSGYVLNTVQKIAGATMVDLNQVRTAVAGGKSVAEAFATLMSTYDPTDFSAATDASGKVTGFTVSAPQTNIYTADNEAYNNNGNFAMHGSSAHMSSYDIDYASWFGSNDKGTSLAGYLNNKGFRFYADDSDSTWYNVTFTDHVVEDQIGDRPASGNATQSIKTMVVDVRSVKTAEDLVNAIVSQTKDKMPSNYAWSKDAANGLLTLYDTTRDTTATDNEKIADGPYDNVVVATRNVMVESIRIQDTDRGSQYTQIDIPKTSLDHLFSFIPGTIDVKKEYAVMTKDQRDALLGTDKNPGYIDRALEYLLDANTLVGAQTSRMAYDHANIVTASENTQASESTIRDADMAKEMTEYTKANVLAQSAQSMLAQANQNSSSVLSLLQG